MADGFILLGKETGTSADKAETLRRRLTEIPIDTTARIKLENVDESTAKVAGLRKAVEILPDIKQVGIQVQADGSTIEKAYGMVIQRFPDGSTRITQAEVRTSEANLSEQKGKLDKIIPDKKTVDIEAKLNTEKIKAQSDVIQKAVEWKAKLDIAEVEAGTKKFEAIVKSVDNTITDTGKTLTSMFSILNESAGKGTSSFIEQQIKDENQRRNDALEMQKKLTQAQVDQMNARTKALDEGKAMIEIDGKGLQPHLEAFMFEILSAIQVRATAEGQKFLVGI